MLLSRGTVNRQAMLLGLFLALFLAPTMAASKGRLLAPANQFLRTGQELPDGRRGAGMVLLQGNVVVFGGISDGGNARVLICSQECGPSCLSCTLFVLADSHQVTLSFRPFSHSLAVYRNDLHIYNIMDDYWYRNIVPVSGIPPARSHMGFATLGAQAFLFGGIGGKIGWILQHQFATYSSHRLSHPLCACTVVNIMVYQLVRLLSLAAMKLLAGYDPFLCADAGAMGDFWRLDTVSLTWTNVTQGLSPTKRHSMAFASVSTDKIVMYGGQSEGQVRDLRHF